MEEAKQQRAAEEQRNRENGTPGDVDFQRMIRQYRETQSPSEQQHVQPGDMKICICVRKRPISTKEIKRHDYDSVTCVNPVVVVHDCKLKVDGIAKYLDNNSFEFDHTFHEENETEDIYYYAVQPLVNFVVNGGRATVFAYGQTGSGKTYTMQGIQSYVGADLFDQLIKYEEESNTNVSVFVSYFEIYGGRCQDLLNSRQRLNVREDGNGEVVVSDLMELQADTAEQLHAIIDTGNRNRTTHATESNDESSRSHAICQIALRDSRYNQGNGGNDGLIGRFSLIDLAGSERGADTKSHNRQRRMEGAEINKSLLALKECIRALDSNSNHVPYRASKLTLVLKDSFTNKKSRTVMIATVSPAASSADHTINTLRYADRIKERVVGGQAARNAALIQQQSDAKAPAPGALKRQDSGNVPVSARDVKQAPQPSARAPSSNATPQQAQQKPPTHPHGHHGHGHNNNNGGAKQNLNSDFEDDDFLPEEDEEIHAFHRTVQDLFEEEEDILNLHMSVIQENAELLTEEGRLLQQIQGENNDIDSYAARLDQILQRKQELIDIMKRKLDSFRRILQREETYSKQLANKGMPSY
jgi:kinesin family protein 2/24